MAGLQKPIIKDLKWATGKYILFLNPDTKVQKDSIHRLIQFLDENPRTGIVGGKLIYPDGKLQPSYYDFPTVFALKQCVAFYYLNPCYQHKPGDEKEILWLRRLERWGYLYYIPPDELANSINLNPTIPFKIDYPVGACFLVRGEIIKQIGTFDERFFLYCEETDFCLRAKQKGWEIYSVPDAVIIHYAGASTRKTGEKRFQMWAKSQYLYIRKHYGWIPALKLKFLFNRFKKVYIAMINSYFSE
jgi:N-acetylglucosaminyl-diphospho-decaprenol L-rhamnosyltransferase